MATKYCLHCERTIEAGRIIGIGTFILAICTWGFSLLLIPFYSKKCPICKGTDFGEKPAEKKEPVIISTPVNNNDPFEKIKKLQELKDSGVLTLEEFDEKKKSLLEAI